MYDVRFFWPDIRPTGYPANETGYPANETGYPAGYRVSKKAGYPTGQLSGATLIITHHFMLEFC